MSEESGDIEVAPPRKLDWRVCSRARRRHHGEGGVEGRRAAGIMGVWEVGFGDLEQEAGDRVVRSK